jgi:hypothetical protein
LNDRDRVRLVRHVCQARLNFTTSLVAGRLSAEPGQGRSRGRAARAHCGKGERAGGKRIEPCRRWHSRQPGGRELARDRDRRQHEPGDQITWQPSDPIAAQRCEQPGPAFGFLYLPVLAALAAGFAPAFALRTAAWYLRRMSAMFTCADGSFRPISSIVSAMISDIARSRNHL